MPFVNIKSKDEVKRYCEEHYIVLVIYGADWCPGCIKGKPVLKKKAKEISFPILFVDVEKVAGFMVEDVPAFEIFVNKKSEIYFNGDLNRAVNLCDSFNELQLRINKDKLEDSQDLGAFEHDGNRLDHKERKENKDHRHHEKEGYESLSKKTHHDKNRKDSRRKDSEKSKKKDKHRKSSEKDEVISSTDIKNLKRKYPVLVFWITDIACPACNNVRDEILDFAKRKDVMVGVIETAGGIEEFKFGENFPFEAPKSLPTFVFYREGQYSGDLSTSLMEKFINGMRQAFPEMK